MADNTNKVTIDADYFVELFRKANETDPISKECREEHTAEEFNALTKERDNLVKEMNIDAKKIAELANERDELKAKLAEHADLLQRTEAENEELKAKLEKLSAFYESNKCCGDKCVLNDKLAAAERCIEDVWNCMSPQEIADNEYAHIDIIRAYREKKEAAR